jgi:hypothetical protein
MPLHNKKRAAYRMAVLGVTDALKAREGRSPGKTHFFRNKAIFHSEAVTLETVICVN